MNLRQIEISGFKSFGKKAALDFKTAITAIVGPNGSGKSNVAEAFSFVLGEQSIKSLRGKKGEDLIYNGSHTGTRANRASVKVVFDNRKRLLDIPYDEVSIERQVHRDGVNEYLINGSQVRLKDVIELLAGANIGSTGHHIISQGEADRVLSVNAKERKAIIEDALGLKIYQIKRKESERKLEKTEENIGQITSLRTEIKPHLTFLRKQVEKIEKTLEMRSNLVSMYKEYFKIENIYIKNRKEEIEKESKEPKEQLKKLELEIVHLEKEIGKNKDKSEESKILRNLEDKISDLRQEKGKLILELGRFEGELRSLKKIAENSGMISGGESQIPLSKVEKLLKSVETKFDYLKDESDVSKIKIAFVEIKNSFKEFLGSISGSGQNKASFKEDISSLENKIRETDSKMKSLISEESKLKEEYQKIRTEIEKNQNTSIEAERRVFDLKTEKNDLLIKLNNISVQREKLEIEEGEFKREMTSAAIVAGREALDFENESIKDDKGFYLDKEDILKEDRVRQESRRKEIEKIKIRLEDAGGASGEEIIKEYNEVKERDEFLEREIADLQNSAVSLKTLIKELEEKLDNEFIDGLHKINDQFQEFFALMFGGGTASLKIVKEKKEKIEEGEEYEEEEEDAPSDGVLIDVNLPRKKIKGLMMLSGGERALTSIALLFAMSQVKPPPFIILDETDAALDEANSKKYGDMITNLSKHSQLILITHNRETMSRAGVLYGVTMDSTGVSKLLSVDLEEAVEVAK
jgi:chromosome segregation protein